MIQPNKLPLVLLVCLIAQFSLGQRYSVHKEKKSYFEFSAGLNFSIPKVTERYSVLSSTDEDFEKDYDKFGKNTGAQFGISYSYNFTNAISINAGFGYQIQGFKYFTDYSWNDTIEQQNLDREMHHIQKITYFTVPVMARWDMTNSQLIPFVQGGLFFDFRHQARKEIIYDNTIDGEETENQTSSSGKVEMTDHTRKFNMGLIGGLGVSYYTKFFTIGLESNFKYGFFKIIKDENRYIDQTGFALPYLDVMDQFKLSNWNVQFTVSIPINHSVTTNILRRRRY